MLHARRPGDAWVVGMAGACKLRDSTKQGQTSGEDCHKILDQVHPGNADEGRKEDEDGLPVLWVHDGNKEYHARGRRRAHNLSRDTAGSR